MRSTLLWLAFLPLITVDSFAQVQIYANHRATQPSTLETAQLNADGSRFVSQYRSGNFMLLRLEDRFGASQLVALTGSAWGPPYQSVSSDFETVVYSNQDHLVIWKAVGGGGILPLSTTGGMYSWFSTFSGLTSRDGQMTFGRSGPPVLNGPEDAQLSWDGLARPELLCNPLLAVCDWAMSDVNGDGTRGLARSSVPGPVKTIYVWDHLTGLTSIANGNSSFDAGRGSINDAGTVAYGVDLDGTVFRWTEIGGLTNIGLPLGLSNAASIQTNASGDMVLEGSSGAIWRAGTGWTAISDYLASRGASGLQSGAFSFSDCRGLSDDGQAFIANLTQANSTQGSRTAEVIVHMADRAPLTLGGNFCGPSQFNQSGFPGTLFALGSTSVQDNNVTLVTQTLPAGSTGYVLNSPGQGYLPMAGGSRGTLCIGGGQPIGRHNGPGQIGIADAQGSFWVALDLTQLPSPLGPIPAMVGETRNFQVWYRDMDSNGMPTSNFTDAVSITFD